MGIGITVFPKLISSSSLFICLCRRLVITRQIHLDFVPAALLMLVIFALVELYQRNLALK